jgi:two-component system chemotaxis sensor kinase CheA
VVVKNLETNYRKVPGISGATILGDGNVALIIDVAAVQRANREKAARRSRGRPATVNAAAAAASRAIETAMTA